MRSSPSPWPESAKFIAMYGSSLLNMYGPASPFVIVQTLEWRLDSSPKEVDPMYSVEARWSMKPGNRKESSGGAGGLRQGGEGQRAGDVHVHGELRR